MSSPSSELKLYVTGSWLLTPPAYVPCPGLTVGAAGSDPSCGSEVGLTLGSSEGTVVGCSVDSVAGGSVAGDSVAGGSVAGDSVTGGSVTVSL